MFGSSHEKMYSIRTYVGNKDISTIPEQIKSKIDNKLLLQIPPA